MKRFLLFFALIAFSFSLVGCREKQYATIEEAAMDGAVLGEKIIIDGIDVSGMPVLEARRALMSAQDKRVAANRCTVRAGGVSVVIEGDSLGINFDTDAVLAQAASLSKKVLPWGEARELRTSVSVDAKSIARAAQTAAATLNKPAVNAEAYFDRNAETSFSYINESTGIEVDANKLALWLDARARALEGGAAEAAASDVPAEYTREDAQNDTQLICEYSSSFKGSTYSKPNRVFNIVKAASLIDGLVINPGETFSINAALGPRNGENGWKIATGIKYGTYVQEYGGGVCQVSSTLYNAALMADLEITERYHHSWPLGYIPVGRDATISTGGPDLLITNASPARIFIRAFTDEKEKTVTVRLYGRPLADGVTIRVTSKKTGTLEDLGMEVEVDPALAPGEEKIVRESRVGVSAETYKEYYAADGSLVRTELVSRDKYRSIKGLMYIGPALPSPTLPGDGDSIPAATPGGTPE